MIPKELLAALRTIEIHTARLANEQLSGTYTSSFKGQGLAFREERPYQPGDDVRTIDWNVSARMNEAFVKVFVEEREMTGMLVVELPPGGQKSRLYRPTEEGGEARNAGRARDPRLRAENESAGADAEQEGRAAP